MGNILRFNNLPTYTPDSTIDILRSNYVVIKTHHNDIPKLQKRTLQNMNRCKAHNGNGGHCHSSGMGQRMICFTPQFLKKRAGNLNFLGHRDDNNKRVFKVLTDTMALGEVLTHEVAHFTIKGKHNKRFYERQNKLFNTFINAVISGELYQ